LSKRRQDKVVGSNRRLEGGWRMLEERRASALTENHPHLERAGSLVPRDQLLLPSTT
jgi:hypothetical protein